MRYFLLAVGSVALLASVVSAGPLRERLAARRGAASCSSCDTCTATPAVAAPAKTVPAAAPAAKSDPVTVQSCPGGVCPAPSARRGILGFR